MKPINAEISIHALREEGDGMTGEYTVEEMQFLSTPSARRATPHLHSAPSAMSHFYPRPPRGGRPSGPTSPISPDSISIHALREEGDS